MKFCWVTIHVREMEKSLQFYEEVINLKVNRRMKPNTDMEIVFLGIGETQVELIYNAKARITGIGEDISLGFVVDSIEKMHELLKEKNIPVHSGPFQPNPFIRFIYVLDPNGVKIQFVEHIK